MFESLCKGRCPSPLRDFTPLALSALIFWGCALQNVSASTASIVCRKRASVPGASLALALVAPVAFLFICFLLIPPAGVVARGQGLVSIITGYRASVLGA